MSGESKLQTRIRKCLKKSGWLVVKMVLTSLPGWPDLCAIKNGRTVWLEVKDNKKLDPLQEYRMEEIHNHGGESFKVGTWEEFLTLDL